MSTTHQQVTLARPWKDPEGVTHKPDTTVSVDVETAETLLFFGYARPANDSKKKG